MYLGDRESNADGVVDTGVLAVLTLVLLGLVLNVGNGEDEADAIVV